MNEPRWLTIGIVVAMHADQVREHGGALGIRDQGLLESALERPCNQFHYGETTDVAALAASYCFGLAKNHAFVDGNKRIAFQAMFVFLALNGFRLSASEDDAVRTILSLASSEIDQDGLSSWIRANATPR